MLVELIDRLVSQMLEVFLREHFWFVFYRQRCHIYYALRRIVIRLSLPFILLPYKFLSIYRTLWLLALARYFNHCLLCSSAIHENILHESVLLARIL